MVATLKLLENFNYYYYIYLYISTYRMVAMKNKFVGLLCVACIGQTQPILVSCSNDCSRVTQLWFEHCKNIFIIVCNIFAIFENYNITLRNTKLHFHNYIGVFFME